MWPCIGLFPACPQVNGIAASRVFKIGFDAISSDEDYDVGCLWTPLFFEPLEPSCQELREEANADAATSE
jgi:hypothetical protein